MNTVMSFASSSDSFAPSPGYYASSLIGYLVLAFFLSRVFTKAGVTSWYAWVPFVNLFKIVEIAGRGVGTFILLFIPVVNVVMWIIVALRLGRAFGKGGVFSFFLLAWFHLVGIIIIAVDESTYNRAAVAS